ncbi:hypothetical protein J437_LFUL013676 [Ladona fulva]|uniref:Uncharacterized protein n=1 Tax=Ladona fulva TaxID=123851 RepID=A0A8K0KD29_LADFU|nr:hypothetical protein J437_LFUL013676 [Ladona fulva]
MLKFGFLFNFYSKFLVWHCFQWNAQSYIPIIWKSLFNLLCTCILLEIEFIRRAFFCKTILFSKIVKQIVLASNS